MRERRDATDVHLPVRLRPLRDRSVGERLEHWARSTPDAPAIVFAPTGESLTYGGLQAAANRMATQLRGVGLQQHDHVGVMVPNSLDWTITCFGSIVGGFVDVGIDHDAKGDLLRHYLASTDVRVAVCFADQLEAVADVWADCPRLERVLVLGDRAAAADPRVVPCADLPPADGQGRVPRDPRDPTSIRFTSGTSGTAKATQLSGSHLEVWASHFVHVLGFERLDRLYTPFPLSHHLASVGGVVASVFAGGCCILDRKFSRRAFWSTAKENGATLAHVIQPVMAMLMSGPPHPDDATHSVRLCYMASEPAAEFEARFNTRMFRGYGLTEGSILAYLAPGDPDTTGADVGGAVVGRPNPLFEVAVLDEWDEEAPVGERGNICFRPREPFLAFQGYYNSVDATVESTRNQWFHTGDVGAFDAAAFLHFFGRSGETVRRKGVMIPVVHVEDAARSYPGVVDAAVIGVPSALGESELKLLVLEDDNGTVDRRGLIEHLCGVLPRPMVPRFLEVRDSFPRTRTFKVLKRELALEGDHGLTTETVSTEQWIAAS